MPKSHDPRIVARLPSHLGIGLLVGTGAGALAGAADLAIAIAFTAKRDALFVALFFATYGLAVGAVFGAITGFALSAVTLPFTMRPRVLRRLRLVWGLFAAAIVAGLCVMTFGAPSLHPGPNETVENVRSDFLWFYAGPTILALTLGIALTPLLARGGLHPGPAPGV